MILDFDVNHYAGGPELEVTWYYMVALTMMFMVACIVLVVLFLRWWIVNAQCCGTFHSSVVQDMVVI